MFPAPVIAADSVALWFRCGWWSPRRWKGSAGPSDETFHKSDSRIFLVLRWSQRGVEKQSWDDRLEKRGRTRETFRRVRNCIDDRCRITPWPFELDNGRLADVYQRGRAVLHSVDWLSWFCFGQNGPARPGPAVLVQVVRNAFAVVRSVVLCSHRITNATEDGRGGMRMRERRNRCFCRRKPLPIEITDIETRTSGRNWTGMFLPRETRCFSDLSVFFLPRSFNSPICGGV